MRWGVAFLLNSHRERALGEHLSGLVGLASGSRLDAHRTCVHLASVGAADCPPRLKPATQGGHRPLHSGQHFVILGVLKRLIQ